LTLGLIISSVTLIKTSSSAKFALMHETNARGDLQTHLAITL